MKQPASAMAIIVMGVSGCGKSTIGLALAEKLTLPFLEGDQLHPPENIRKMSQGIALSDQDRWPWLSEIGRIIADALDRGEGLVVSCSALKRSYRDHLRQAAGGHLSFVYLSGSEALLAGRMGARSGHFMPPALLQSQLATLEAPTDEAGVVTVSIDQPIEAITAEALAGLMS